ncbi:UDP-N-acetylmuramoyl-L-alanine--D-glutamate ligase [Agaribacter flavus]|uniref:UDP-N-acetylmuramoylalanine--D-glutamate ligase n=1 Tax=Agaribacter flavus TaxID=1902781 RepID=A0ABV7FKX8_9ALTE
MHNTSFDTQYQDKAVAVIGFGVTGQACVKFMLARGANVTLFDSKYDDLLDKQIDDPLLVQVKLARFDESSEFEGFHLVLVSPGVNTQKNAIQRAIKLGLPLVSDIELFARHNTTPTIGITGSNGKSTVVDMLNTGLSKEGLKVAVGGNFGNSVLELLDEQYDVIVLELSSFQLELTFSLKLSVAAILNVSEDHIDRHGDLLSYARAKQGIYKHADVCIFNRDDVLTAIPPEALPESKSQGVDDSRSQRLFSFGKTAPLACSQAVELAIFENAEGLYINNAKILKYEAIAHLAKHNVLNLQVALLCAKAILKDDNAFKKCTMSLMTYRGLAHRFSLVRQTTLANGMQTQWINDSKATNPGAAIAAINCINENDNLVLLVGGDSKGTDLSELKSLISSRVNLLLSMGKDARRFAGCCANTEFVASMESAVNAAKQYVETCTTNSVVLLSPACASMDMFKNYQHRGEVFEQAVNAQEFS